MVEELQVYALMSALACSQQQLWRKEGRGGAEVKVTDRKEGGGG